MFLPMMGFMLALIVVGSLAILVAIGDPKHAALASYIGFACLFAGLGALCLLWGLSLLGEALHSQTLAGIGFFGGYAVGGLGGALLGLGSAYRRHRRLSSTNF